MFHPSSANNNPNQPTNLLQAGGVEAITEAMESFPGNLMIQLAALLSLIPLTLDNCMMQVGCADDVCFYVWRR